MGKAMMNGRVLYRDIFDHRGPLLYFLYGLAYIISNTTFLGVFIFEVISFSFFLFFSFKILSLYIDKEYALIAIPLLAVAVLNLKSFAHGGSPEEFCLPFIAISLFGLINYLKNDYPNPISNRWLSINGFIAGCVLWIKFSLLGFWFGWIVSILIVMLINKQVSIALKASLLFFLGMVAATLPWILYFGINHSIAEWINSYFLINLQSYTDYKEATALIPNLRYIPIKFFGHLLLNPIIVGHLYLGFYVFLTNKKFVPEFLKKLSISLCFLLLSITVFGFGQSYTYYFLIFSPFIIFGFIVMLTLVNQKFGEFVTKKSFIAVILTIVTMTFVLTLLFQGNTDMLKVEEADLVQYKFASIINETEDATLLNFGSLDAGFYTVTGIIPNTRFFQRQNILSSRFPLSSDEQNRYIKEQLVDYAVAISPATEFDNSELNPYLFRNYTLIETEEQEYENEEYFYLLFRKK